MWTDSSPPWPRTKTSAAIFSSEPGRQSARAPRGRRALPDQTDFLRAGALAAGLAAGAALAAGRADLAFTVFLALGAFGRDLPNEPA